LDYDLGYAYFKSKDFASAQEYFKEYLRFPKQEFKADAELRLADTYYANNQLNEALKFIIKPKMPAIILCIKSFGIRFQRRYSGEDF
jgi:uncharacterized protein HemY